MSHPKIPKNTQQLVSEGSRKQLTLSPAERVLAAFEKRKIDRIAIYHGGFSSRVASVLIGHEAYVGGGINQWREATALWDGPDTHAEFVCRTRDDSRALAKAVQADMVRIGYWRMNTKPTRKIDQYTFLFGDPAGDYQIYQLDPETELYQVIAARNSNPPPTIDDLEREVIASEKSLESFHPTAAESLREEIDALGYFGTTYAIPCSGYALGISREPIWLEATLLRPDLVERLLDCQCERGCRLFEAQKDSPFRYYLGGGDFCGNAGPIYSPRIFHEMMLPRLQRMSATAHKHGKFTAFASDGNLWPVANDLFGASGTDAYYEIDRDAGMDLRKLRTQYPHLTCFGNISSVTLHRGTRDQVIAETRDNAEAALELGGILCGVSNQVLSMSPIENVMAMLKTLDEYH